MNKRYSLFFFPLIVIFILGVITPLYADSDLHIGIFRLYSPYLKNNLHFHTLLEDSFQGVVSDISAGAIYALDGRVDQAAIKKILAAARKNEAQPEEVAMLAGDILDEIEDLDYCFLPEVLSFDIVDETDFYDTNIIYQILKVDVNILLIDAGALNFIEHHRFNVKIRIRKDKTDIEAAAVRQLTGKFKTYIASLVTFKPRIKSISHNRLHVVLNKGQDVRLRGGDLLSIYDLSGDMRRDQLLVRVLWVGPEKSIASILTGSTVIADNIVFIKKNKINLELQFAGGFSLSDKDNQVLSRFPEKSPVLSILGFAQIRGCIPVGLGFFRPVFAAEFTFLSTQNRLLMPFTIETGGQGELYLNRFEMAAGLLLGALFSPDANSVYQIDSVSVRPYLQIGVMLVSGAKLFAEVGYRFFVEGILYKSWQIDLKGVYFQFGIGVKL